MIIDKLGYYRTRDGELAYVVSLNTRDPERLFYPVIGYTKHVYTAWTINGYHSIKDNPTKNDLIEYLGTELPSEVTNDRK